MIAVSDANHPNVEEIVTGRIKISEVYRAKNTVYQISAEVLGKLEDSFYKLGTTYGILKQEYERFDCNVRKETLIFDFQQEGMLLLQKQLYVKQQ